MIKEDSVYEEFIAFEEELYDYAKRLNRWVSEIDKYAYMFFNGLASFTDDNVVDNLPDPDRLKKEYEYKARSDVPFSEAVWLMKEIRAIPQATQYYDMAAPYGYLQVTVPKYMKLSISEFKRIKQIYYKASALLIDFILEQELMDESELRTASSFWAKKDEVYINDILRQKKEPEKNYFTDLAEQRVYGY